MKSSFFLRTCGLAALLLVMNGCAHYAQPRAGAQETVAQSAATGYHPPYAYAQNVAPSRLDQHPLQPAPQQRPSPPPAQQPAPPSGQIIPPLTVMSAARPPVPANGQIKVAILLPLSGPNAALGQAMLNAAQQAVFDAAGTDFRLLPHDTEAVGGAQAAANAAVQEGAQLIIGPLFATNIPAVKLVASHAGLQILPLSTDTSQAEPGVYVMGLAPAAQVRRIIAYANAHMAGAAAGHRFAALVPATPYGALVGQVFEDAVKEAGGTVVDYETYDSVAQDTGNIENLTDRRSMIDALFLPEGGDDLKTVTQQLAAAGFNGTQIHMLGTGLWDVPGLGQQNPLLVGGWYAAPDPAARKNFTAAYASAYGKNPPRLATLAYDATALAAVLAKRGGRYDATALQNPNGFAGLDGIFRLLSSGKVERGLAVNEVTPYGAHVIDPSPVSFVGRK
ncbi:MAG: penicillin-binding protein activator [Alphaproteobacteria bacterium]|nr:penicillin-binding protein activator [Alphaproteobacteria bacterium]